MKLEVGMYVRTKIGIGRLLYFNEELEEWVNEEYNYYTEDFILKASHNIIDLIEVGDFVNGEYVDLFSLDYFKRHPEHIKSIVTKEQFEAMQYKVV